MKVADMVVLGCIGVFVLLCAFGVPHYLYMHILGVK